MNTSRSVAALLAYLFFGLATSGVAQVASGGQFGLGQTALASGGTTAASGGQFVLGGTIGQPVAGGPSSRDNFSAYAGFLNPDSYSPTAADVAVSGRVVTAAGQPIGKAYVSLTDQNGDTRLARTNPLGYFAFEGVESGRSYLLTARHRSYSFQPMLLNVLDQLADLSEIAEP